MVIRYIESGGWVMTMCVVVEGKLRDKLVSELKWISVAYVCVCRLDVGGRHTC